MKDDNDLRKQTGSNLIVLTVLDTAGGRGRIWKLLHGCSRRVAIDGGLDKLGWVSAEMTRNEGGSASKNKSARSLAIQNPREANEQTGNGVARDTLIWSCHPSLFHSSVFGENVGTQTNPILSQVTYLEVVLKPGGICTTQILPTSLRYYPRHNASPWRRQT